MYDALLQLVVEAAVPSLGDWCGCVLVDGDHLVLAALAQADGIDPSLATALHERWPQPLSDDAPTPYVVASGATLLLDVEQHHLENAARSEAHLQRLRALNTETALFVPLVADGEVLGALVLLHTTSGRRHTEDDIPLAEGLAARAATAIGHAHSATDIEQRLALLDALYESAPVGIAFIDHDLRYQRVNGHLAALNGMAADAHLGRTPTEILGDVAEPVTDLLRGILADGRTITGEIEAETELASGARHFLVGYAPVSVGEERIGISGVVMDITQRRATERREHLIARVGAEMDAELDSAVAAQRLCELLVAEVGDACMVHLRDEDHITGAIAAAHRTPEGRELVERLARKRPVRMDRAGAGADAMRAQEALLLAHISDEMRLDFAVDAEELEIVDGLDMRSAVIAPLVARGKAIGVVSVLRHATAPPLDEDDRRFMEEVARRAGLTLDNLRLYTGQRHISSALQSSLLPRRLPEIAGLEVATSYRAAGEHNDVGGDFFDVFHVPDGPWTALVGDVAGKGPEAAALTASVRQIVRTGSRWTEDAQELLAVVNDELYADADARTCTLAHVSIHDEGDATRVAVTLAGHPQPLLLRSDGEVEAVGRPGTLLGGLRELDVDTQVVTLGPGDLLLLYTDGAVETGRGRPGAPLLDLRPVLAGCATSDPHDIARCVEEAAVEAAGGTAPDDIALVLLRRRP